MLINRITLYIILLFFTIFVQCCTNDKEVVKVDLGYDYYPIQKGHFIVYTVDSFFYNDFTYSIDSFSFQVKEKIAAEYTDLSNQKSYTVERYYRKTANESWVLKDIWNTLITSATAEKTEENIRFIKLVFPLKKELSWNGNRLNALGEQSYIINAIHAPLTINGQLYDSTLTVLQEADSSLIQKKYALEIYAKNVGLVYKRFVDVADKDSVINYTLPLAQRISSGVDYTYRVIATGVE